MARPLTPKSSFVTEFQIEEFRKTRWRTKFEGCTQLHQLFVKADGTMSCSCMRYWDILADVRTIDVGKFYNGKMMKFIRESFAEGYEPFSFCKDCASRLSTYDKTDTEYDFIDLHIEPSNQCNLYCEACTCTFERQTANAPPRVSLDYGLYEKVLNEVKAAGLSVRHLALVGFGEPLFHARIPDMARLGRALFPNAFIFVDTNANFGRRRAEELACCGLDEIRLALDGSDQASYELYRRNGKFTRALQFTRDLAAEIRRTNSSTRAVWKYILFRHNDRDDQILKAVKMASEIGVPIIFDATVGPLASKRTSAEIEALVNRPLGCNIDPRAVEKDSTVWGRLSRLRPKLRRAAKPAG